MSDFKGLNWDLYPEYEEITTNSELSTTVFAFESDVAESVYEKLVLFLKTHNYKVDEELIEDTIKRSKVYIQNKQVGWIEPISSWLIIRNDDPLHQLVSDFIFKNYEDEFRSAGNVEHVENVKILEKKGYRIRFRSGTDESKDNLTPYSFFELYHNDGELLAKAILEYFNGEMGEVEPTILLIEVHENNRQKGIGSYFLQFIECQLAKWGFFTIWSSDTRNIGFWEKMGYEIDVDEGVKGLDPLDCGEGM